VTSHLHALAVLFAANPLAQSVGLLAFVIGISAFVQRNDQRLRTFLTLYCIVIGAHFFLLGAHTAAYAAWLSGFRSFVSTHTRHVAVMCFSC
jgi:Bacterial inner membrane protein.